METLTANASRRYPPMSHSFAVRPLPKPSAYISRSDEPEDRGGTRLLKVLLSNKFLTFSNAIAFSWCPPCLIYFLVMGNYPYLLAVVCCTPISATWFVLSVRNSQNRFRRKPRQDT